ncbi:hypothetical protein [Chryseobacterium gossypii]|uniref:hypothetical protein n=1 Tax=Chryseobacterium gossypii TaxID=3231602 RepID=UPI0035259650
MRIKNIWRSYPFIILIGIFLYFYFSGKNNNNKFYNNKINCKIVDSNNWQRRTVEYKLENGLKIDITILDSIKLKVGDSISKEANSKSYNVYRKSTSGKYNFYKNYNIDK